MTLLSMLQNAASEFAETPPTAIVNATDVFARQLLAHTYRVGNIITRSYDFPYLIKEYTFSTTASQASYALPDDFRKFIIGTAWDRTNSEPLSLISAADWQQYKSGISTASIYKKYRIKGSSLKRFFIEPTPSATESLVFEYLSKDWFTPPAWAASTAYTLNQYVSYNGNNYKCTVAGTSGVTAPSHTTGTSADGSVTWSYQSSYSTFNSDSDLLLISDDVVGLGVQWRYLTSRGLDTTQIKMDFYEALKNEYINQVGAKDLNLVPGGGTVFINESNIPDTGYGS